MTNQDIEGSQPGSHVVGIRVPDGAAKRHLNPLEPAYQMPGHTEAAPGDMFGEGLCSMSKGNFKSRLEAQKEALRAKLNGPQANAENKNPNVEPLRAVVPMRPASSQGSKIPRPTSALSNNSDKKSAGAV